MNLFYNSFILLLLCAPVIWTQFSPPPPGNPAFFVSVVNTSYPYFRVDPPSDFYNYRWMVKGNLTRAYGNGTGYFELWARSDKADNSVPKLSINGTYSNGDQFYYMGTAGRLLSVNESYLHCRATEFQFFMLRKVTNGASKSFYLDAYQNVQPYQNWQGVTSINTAYVGTDDCSYSMEVCGAGYYDTATSCTRDTGYVAMVLLRCFTGTTFYVDMWTLKQGQLSRFSNSLFSSSSVTATNYAKSLGCSIAINQVGYITGLNGDSCTTTVSRPYALDYFYVTVGHPSSGDCSAYTDTRGVYYILQIDTAGSTTTYTMTTPNDGCSNLILFSNWNYITQVPSQGTSVNEDVFVHVAWVTSGNQYQLTAHYILFSSTCTGSQCVCSTLDWNYINSGAYYYCCCQQAVYYQHLCYSNEICSVSRYPNNGPCYITGCSPVTPPGTLYQTTLTVQSSSYSLPDPVWISYPNNSSFSVAYTNAGIRLFLFSAAPNASYYFYGNYYNSIPYSTNNFYLAGVVTTSMLKLSNAGSFAFMWKNGSDIIGSSNDSATTGTILQVSETARPGYYHIDLYNTALGNYYYGFNGTRICDTGSFSTWSQTSCTICAAGYYQTVGGTSCGTCPAGTYSAAGATTCTNCSAGTYSSTTLSTTCSACASNSVSSSGSSSCFDCSSIHAVVNASNPAQCIFCGNNQIPTTVNGQYNQICQFCPVGQDTNGANFWQCTNCNLGYFRNVSASTTMNCTLCYPGTYDNAYGASSCLACNVSQLCGLSGVINPQVCPPGQYAASNLATTCSSCASGTYSNAYAATSCISCPAGSIQQYTGQTFCTQCSAGYTAVSTVLCQQCGGNNFTSIAGTFQACTNCPVGRITLTDHTGCQDCPAGYYNNDITSSTCQTCPAGSFTQGAASACANCVAGKYQADIGSSTCNDCQAGYFCPGGFTDAPCPQNTYSAADASVCTNCPDNTVSNGAHTGCISCGGTQGAYGAQTTCTSCTANTQPSGGDQFLCLACPPGYQVDPVTQSSCQACPAGTYSADGITCRICPYNMVSPQNTSSSCSTCGFNTVPSDNRTVCLPCGSGFTTLFASFQCKECLYPNYATYPTQANAAGCVSCVSGVSNTTHGITLCLPCAGDNQCNGCFLGAYVSSGGNCTSCPQGTFSVLGNVTSCTNCSAGSYQYNTGQSTCNLCPIDAITTTSGLANCTACNLGTQSGQGASSCSSCNIGSYRDNSLTSCVQCAPGKFQNQTGQSFCYSCDTGKYQSNQGGSICTACDVGYYANTVGNSYCSPCAKGTYTGVTGTVTCTPCDYNTYQPNYNQASCITCPNGGFTLSTGQTVCSNCLGGTFLNSTTKQCIPCSLGYYSTGLNQASCTACGPNQVSGIYSYAITGATTCSYCLSGQTVVNEVCVDCPVGKFQYGTTCTNCLPGSFNNQGGQVSCLSCPPGQYNNLPAQQGCFPCAAGTYANNYLSTTCTNCPAGTFSVLGNTATCQQCPTGSYSSSAGSPDCLPCPSGTESKPDHTGCQTIVTPPDTGSSSSSSSSLATKDIWIIVGAAGGGLVLLLLFYFGVQRSRELAQVEAIALPAVPAEPPLDAQFVMQPSAFSSLSNPNQSLPSFLLPPQQMEGVIAANPLEGSNYLVSTSVL